VFRAFLQLVPVRLSAGISNILVVVPVVCKESLVMHQDRVLVVLVHVLVYYHIVLIVVVLVKVGKIVVWLVVLTLVALLVMTVVLQVGARNLVQILIRGAVRMGARLIREEYVIHVTAVRVSLIAPVTRAVAGRRRHLTAARRALARLTAAMAEHRDSMVIGSVIIAD
jgi:hypothetical protein